MDTRKMFPALVAAILFGISAACPVYAASVSKSSVGVPSEVQSPAAQAPAETKSEENKEQVNTLEMDEEDELSQIERMSMREVILLRLRAAHEKGLFLDITEDQINKLTESELNILANTEVPQDVPQEKAAKEASLSESLPSRKTVKEDVASMSDERTNAFFTRVRRDLDPETGTYGIMLAILGSAGAGGFLLLKHQRDRIIAGQLEGKDIGTALRDNLRDETGDLKITASKIEAEKNRLKQLSIIKKTSLQDALDVSTTHHTMFVPEPTSLERVKQSPSTKTVSDKTYLDIISNGKYGDSLGKPTKENLEAYVRRGLKRDEDFLRESMADREASWTAHAAAEKEATKKFRELANKNENGELV